MSRTFFFIIIFLIAATSGLASVRKYRFSDMEETNLVKNGNLKDGTDNWNTWQPKKYAEFTFNKRSKYLNTAIPDSFSLATWYQPIKNFNKNTAYKAQCMVRTKDILSSNPWGGAQLKIEFWKKGKWAGYASSPTMQGTNVWHKIECRFQAPDNIDEIRICPFMVNCTGEASFKNLSITECAPFEAPVFTENENLDSLGGWENIKGEKTGFFHVEKIRNRWWIIDPEGNVFISMGVNAMAYNGDEGLNTGTARYRDTVSGKYKTRDEWAKNTVKRIQGLGFNTVGSWSDDETFNTGIPYTKILYLGDKAINYGGLSVGCFADVFSDKFAAWCKEIAEQECSTRKDDPLLLGYFLDNEMKWLGGWEENPKSLLERYIESGESKGKSCAIEMLRQKYGTIEKLSEVYDTGASDWNSINSLQVKKGEFGKALRDRLDFLGLVAERYFEVTTRAIRKCDPNHMVLGCRYAYNTPEPVWVASGKFTDINSVNIYDQVPSDRTLKHCYKLSNRPIMITEFSFKAMDSGLPNANGAGTPLLTQKDRAEYYTRYVSETVKLPFIVGFHWFKLTDQPYEGRANPPDGENSNYGLVNEKDELYETLGSAMSNVNKAIYNLAK
ncbi:MAG: hypothetical protein JW728_07315 [Candidatus Aureabacteria bacterium]|nr:hypothetical protein [Candidatus Auribacterota bacterium]